MRSLWLEFVFFPMCFAHLAVAGINNLSESSLFRWVPAEGRYELVAVSEIQPKNLYLRWENRQQKYIWVTGDDRHEILTNSKVQGGRLGLEGSAARNWFVPSNGSVQNPWKKSTERRRPQVWRFDPARVVGTDLSTGTYVSETASDNWESWGGDLDPIVIEPPPIKPPAPIPDPGVPPPEPNEEEISCTLTVSPNSPRVGERILITMTTAGPVTAATLDGAAVDFPMVVRMKIGDRPVGAPKDSGSFVLAGSVKGLRSSAQCEIQITFALP